MFIEQIKKYKTRKLNFCDIGARDGTPNYWNLAKEDITNILFEADPEEYERLRKICSSPVFPSALGSKTEDGTLYLTKSRRCSSLYRPNIDFLKNFPNSDRFDVEKEVSIKIMALDSFLNDSETLQNLDFLKLDTQGSELDIIKGGESTLRNTIGLEVEVEFSELYKNQALFREVDGALAELDFELFDLRKTYWKPTQAKGLASPKGRLIFGDALYLKKQSSLFELCKLKKEDSRNILINALIISNVYGVFDYCYEIISDQSFLLYFNEEEKADLIKYLKVESESLYLPFLISRNIPFLPSIINFLFNLIVPNYNGWSYAENNLGSRKKRNLFYVN